MAGHEHVDEDVHKDVLCDNILFIVSSSTLYVPYPRETKCQAMTSSFIHICHFSIFALSSKSKQISKNQRPNGKKQMANPGVRCEKSNQ